MSAYISIGTTTNSPAQKNRVFMKAYFFTVFCTKNRGMKTIWPPPLPLTPYENLTGKGVFLLDIAQIGGGGEGLAQNDFDVFLTA